MAFRKLPDYSTPPVVEVAIGAHFQPPANMSTVRIGEFWVANKKDYPRSEDFPPILDNMTPELISLPPIRRVFMYTPDQRYILQLQADAFIHNWRRVKDEDEYPHFDTASELFKQKFALFKKFVADNDIGELSGTRYEVTYVNHLMGESTIPKVFEEYVGLLKLQPSAERKVLGDPKSLHGDIWFDLPDDLGTLRVSLKQGSRTIDQKEVLQVELTARGKAQPDFSDMDKWLDVAHEWIVQGFTEITTAQAHKVWGRKAL